MKPGSVFIAIERKMNNKNLTGKVLPARIGSDWYVADTQDGKLDISAGKFWYPGPD
jgi:hypothetical protein